ncbi:MAG: hypothetical protein FWC28_08240 [Proteobacteria bacterium]|nr:hypothetical protein [Cystobacterineae bacterium]MCL2258429.1 hypothetical protein [Cystobacterineae bacterium]MCL2315221.1 hypothetical protein [Pseudomonadota bacterium]
MPRVSESGSGARVAVGAAGLISSERGKTASVQDKYDNGDAAQKSTLAQHVNNGYQISSEPIPPKWDNTIYDHDYDYNPNMKPTLKDGWNAVEWGAKGKAAGLIMPDAAAVYNHYRANTGTDFTVNLAKGYKEDTAVKNSVDSEIRRTQESVENLRKQSGLDEFNVSGGLHPNSEYPTTENWQKTLGGFNTWSHAEVAYDKEKKEYQMKITVNVLDRYNFNKGQKDIASGTPDDVNGRFEALGWAKSFNAKGDMTFEVKWKEGEIAASTPAQVNQGR